ncbi:MAG TPA: stage III sporulation protein AC [Clostridia bacterium]|nr:MAG: Stage III sporulation protein AC/AD protein family protein [Firmicutes bacterium ADurb.Bin356]HOF94110.1 stage III sporulation protein AC [Clostridia bacterium]HOR13787.1 stage III sporulation protein AC [Clostridia bacterium]
MNVDMLFKIAGVGILVAVITQLLKQSGRDEMATIAAIVGLVIGLIMMLDLVNNLFESVRQVFQLY